MTVQMNKPTAKKVSRKDAEKMINILSEAEIAKRKAKTVAPAPAAVVEETKAKTAKAKPVKTEKPVVELLPFEKRCEMRRVHLTAYNEMRRLQRSGENAKRLSELQAWLKKNGGMYNSQQLSDPALRAALKAA